MFEPAKDFLRLATQKYQLSDQATASWICTRVKEVIAQDYSDFIDFWDPKKFVKGVLTIQVGDSAASSALFLRTHELIEKINTEDLPKAVTEIRIVR